MSDEHEKEEEYYDAEDLAALKAAKERNEDIGDYFGGVL